MDGDTNGRVQNIKMVQIQSETVYFHQNLAINDKDGKFVFLSKRQNVDLFRWLASIILEVALENAIKGMYNMTV